MGHDKSKVRARVIPPDPPPRQPRKILGAPMTREEYVRLAREVAQEEIKVVSGQLAAQVHNGVQQTMVPLGERFSDIYKKCNELDIHVHALVDVLAAKEVLTKPEVREAAERVTNALVARQEMLKKALQEKQAAEESKARTGAEDGDGGAAAGTE